MTFEELQQIACTLGETHIWKPGSSNWYARQGMAHNFIDSDIADEMQNKLHVSLILRTSPSAKRELALANFYNIPFHDSHLSFYGSRWGHSHNNRQLTAE